MGVLSSLLLLAVSAHTIAADHTPLRSGCDPDAPILATLAAGTPVTIRFAMAGLSPACYKVAVTVDGQERTGYLAGEGITSLDDFVQARNAVSGAVLPAAVRSPLEAIQRTMAGRAPSGDAALLQEAVRLMGVNRPGEALRLVGPLVERTHPDPQALAVAGLAAYRADDSRRATLYLKASLQAEPDPAVQRLYSEVTKERNVDRSGERIYGGRFLLRYDGAMLDHEQATQLSSLLESEFSRISLALGCRTPERIAVVIQSWDSYRQAHDAAGWSAGLYDGRIHVPVSPGRDVGAQTRQTLAHELVHACLADLGSWPSWLHEGLAQHLSGETLDPARRSTLQRMIRAGQLPKLGALSGSWSTLTGAQAEVAYSYALHAAEVMVNAYREYGLTNILRNPASLPGVAANLDRLLAQ